MGISEYKPSLPAAVVFAVPYTVVCGITVFQYFWYRCWFWFFMVIAALMETAGYIARAYWAAHLYDGTAFLVQFLLIFLAPALIAASCYMAMGRVMLHVAPVEYQTAKRLWIPLRWMTPIFVSCDVAAFAVQVLGGIFATTDTPSTIRLGYKIMEIGLVLQLLCFGIFIIISFRFLKISQSFKHLWSDEAWVKFLWALNAASCIIFLRSIYRLIEFTQGFEGYLANHEWNFYLFEAALMLPALMVFNIYHPAKYLSNVGWRQGKKTGCTSSMRFDSQTELV